MPALEDLDPSHYYVWFEESSNQLVANGRIPIEGGDLTLARGNGNDNTIYILRQGDVFSGRQHGLRFTPERHHRGRFACAKSRRL